MEKKKVQEDLNQLFKLFEIDMQIDAMHRRKQELPEQLAKFREPLDKAKAELKGFDDKLEELETKRKQLEKEVKLEEERIQKSNEKLMSVKTNEEYQAAVREIDNAKKLNRQREDEILELMEKVESLKGERDKYTAAVDEESQKIKSKEDEIAQQMKEAEDNLLGVDDKRKNSSVRVEDGNILKLYEKIRVHTKDAVVQIYNEFCEACQMTLPPQLFNMVLRMELVHQCPSCRRILYFHPDAKSPKQQAEEAENIRTKNDEASGS